MGLASPMLLSVLIAASGAAHGALGIRMEGAAPPAEAGERQTLDIFKPPTEQELADALGGSDALVQRLARHKAKEHIFFVGDSTSRNAHLALCALLTGDTKAAMTCQGVGQLSHITATSAGRIDAFDPQILQRSQIAKANPPTVIILGSNFHVLHLHPAIPWSDTQRRHFLHYEDDVNETLTAYHAFAPSAQLAPVLANTLCEKMWFGEFRRIFEWSQKNPTQAASQCAENLASKGTETKQDYLLSCSQAFLTSSNVEALNNRFKNAVTRWQQQQQTHLKVAIVDNWHLTRGHCDDVLPNGKPPCNDGIHFINWSVKIIENTLISLGW